MYFVFLTLNFTISNRIRFFVPLVLVDWLKCYLTLFHWHVSLIMHWITLNTFWIPKKKIKQKKTLNTWWNFYFSRARIKLMPILIIVSCFLSLVIKTKLNWLNNIACIILDWKLSYHRKYRQQHTSASSSAVLFVRIVFFHTSFYLLIVTYLIINADSKFLNFSVSFPSMS